MAQLFDVHPDNPQLRLIRQATEIIRRGGVIAYPTDAAYALGCQLGEKTAQERIRQIRQLEPEHYFTLVCCNLSQVANYAKVNNSIFRLLKAYTPGPYTFVLPATHEVPRQLQHPKRKTIGLRIPHHPVTQALLAELQQPLLSVTLSLPGDDRPLTDPLEIIQRLQHQIDLVIACGIGSVEPTTVVDLVGSAPKILRRGKGDPGPFEM